MCAKFFDSDSNFMQNNYSAQKCQRKSVYFGIGQFVNISYIENITNRICGHDRKKT